MRLDITGLIKIPAAYKYYYKVNAYSELDTNRNKVIIMKEYPRYSKSELWKYIIIYSKINNFCLKFIIDMYKEVKGN